MSINSAQSSPANNSSLDVIERQLEMRLHQKLLANKSRNDVKLAEFKTDGCSGWLSVGWKQLSEDFPEFAIRHGQLPPWQECCVIHDQKYHKGGTELGSAEESFELRKQADLALKACVAGTSPKRSAELEEIYGLTEAQVEFLYEAISELMYRAVRLGGMPCTEHPWRWGYGWPKCD